MAAGDSITCPVDACSFTGSLSQVIHHVAEEPDSVHEWNALGYAHSYEFRRQHETKSDTGAEIESADRSEDEIELQEVDAIGDTRAQALRTAGYRHVEDVADASVESLSAIPKISNQAALCIQATAQAALGYEESFITEIAEEYNADRAAVADAYGSMASGMISPAEARPTLEQLFATDPTDSVVELMSYSPQTRHYLREAGFRTIDDVASASIDALTEVPYLSERVASGIRETARERVPETISPEDGSDHAEPTAEQTDETGIPPAMRERDQWLLWKTNENGAKVPRAPWETGDPLVGVDATNPNNWTTYDEAKRWQSKLLLDLELAFSLTGHDDIVLLDLDDVRKPAGLSEPARELLDEAGSYAAVSTSGTGVHIYARGSLSEEVKAITGSFDGEDTGSLEVYDRNRFIAVTGDHIDTSPNRLTDVGPLLKRLENEFAKTTASAPTKSANEPQRSRAELRDIDTTDDIQDVFDAISQTRPADISMDSKLIRERVDGSASYDPSWVHSESGTRLGVTADGWIYRKGMIALDALQVVALEENIINDEREYPEGESFWEAVSALRDRGAHIPKYEPDPETATESAATDEPGEIDQWKVAQYINYGEEVRTHVHRYDRNYMERLALDLAPDLVEYADALSLPPAVAYRAAQLYATGHQAEIIEGASHAATLGAAIRIAATEADAPRPLSDIAETVDESTQSIQGKIQRFLDETSLTDEISASDLFPEPVDYLPYLLQQMDRGDDIELERKVSERLENAETDGSSNPISVVAGAVYAVMKESPNYTGNQRTVAQAAGLSKVTIRNNYRQFLTS